MSHSSNAPTLSVLRHLDVDAVCTAARHESRMRQHALPPVSVYRWWARRTEAVSGALVDAVAEDTSGPLLIADPFAGGGVIALAALTRGHRLYVQDVNPWAARSLATMLGLPDPGAIEEASDALYAKVSELLKRAYSTTFSDGAPAEVSQTLRVATSPCLGCGSVLRLFPASLVSLTERVDCAGGTAGFLACRAGHLQLGPANKRSRCRTCHRLIDPFARYTSGRVVTCAECRWSGRLAELAAENRFEWDVVLVERASPGRREIEVPTAAERLQASEPNWSPVRRLPSIRVGEETGVLRMYGMDHWHDLYPNRQRVLIEELLRACSRLKRSHPQAVRALEAAIIGSVEMAGFASRWDSRYLKAYEAVANHRFNFTTLAVEPNVWGAGDWGRGTVSRRLQQIAKASSWIEEHVGHRLKVEGPVPSSRRRTRIAQGFDARVVAGSSRRICLPDGVLDAVVTDPPYHDDVQYGELADLFRAWTGETTGAVDGDVIASGRSAADLLRYEERLSEVLTEIRRALRKRGHLILSYANRFPGAWAALLGALQSAGFRTVGYTIVHSENETDHAKAGRRACNLDVLIDLVVDDGTPVRRFSPRGGASSDEERFCRIAGRYALEVGNLKDGWRTKLEQDLGATAFLGK
jgi:putative DNA methylase